jgi:hypothetical protein
MELFDDNSPQKQNFGVRADSSNTVLDENDLRLIRRFHVLLHKAQLDRKSLGPSIDSRRK